MTIQINHVVFAGGNPTNQKQELILMSSKLVALQLGFSVDVFGAPILW